MFVTAVASRHSLPRVQLPGPTAADFTREREAYGALVARGGRLKAAASDKPQARPVPVAPETELPPDDALAPTEPMVPTSPPQPEPRR